MIRLLAVDDSALMRRLLTEIFSAEVGFEIETARNGSEAIEKLPKFKPDVVTLDIHMPGMDGLACLDQIMVSRPCPVVMVSSLTAEGAEETLEAMALGAVDFITKPKGVVSLEIGKIAGELVDKVRTASTARIPNTQRLRDRVRASARVALSRVPVASRPQRVDEHARSLPASAVGTDQGIVLVGCSTGGPAALDALLGGLTDGLRWPILIAQHMPASFTGPLAARLDRVCPLEVREVDSLTPLQPGFAYIARGDADVIVTRRGGLAAAQPAPSTADHFWHPSVDRMVESALRHLPAEKLVGVLMTGMGTDGAAAMARLKQEGGTTIAEAESSAVIWGMPGSLVQREGASVVRPLNDIAGELNRLLGR